MPTYFLGLQPASKIDDLDDEGGEYVDLSGATAAAIEGLRDVFAHDIKNEGRINMSQTIEIYNADGQSLHVTAFPDAVTIMP